MPKTIEERLTAIEIALQSLLLEKNVPMKYIKGVLCERKPYEKEYTPVDLSAYSIKAD